MVLIAIFNWANNLQASPIIFDDFPYTKEDLKWFSSEELFDLWEGGGGVVTFIEERMRKLSPVMITMINSSDFAPLPEIDFPVYEELIRPCYLASHSFATLRDAVCRVRKGA